MRVNPVKGRGKRVDGRVYRVEGRVESRELRKPAYFYYTVR